MKDLTIIRYTAFTALTACLFTDIGFGLNLKFTN